MAISHKSSRFASPKRNGTGKNGALPLPQLTAELLQQATSELSRNDPVLGQAISKLGECNLLPRTAGSHFEHLMRSIVYQQLSGLAASRIHARLVALLRGSPAVNMLSREEWLEQEEELPAVDAAAVLAADEESLRACGLSLAKIRAIKDLARHTDEGLLPMGDFRDMSDQEIIDALVAVRGIGPWTAQMFLMFRLGRPDVLPVLDLGVRKGAQRIYKLRSLPDAARLSKIARKWHPWATVASWYCWRVLDADNEGAW